MLLTQMWGQTHNEYGVLSTSPPDVSEMGTPKALGQLQQVPHLCHHYLSDVGIIRNARATSAILKSPILAASWSAGFSFAKCHLDAKVPYDPNLPSITEGEDFTRYARMWTFGYDVYTPPVSVVFHDYHSADSKPYDPTEWTEMGMNKDFIRQEQDAAIRRMRMLIGAHAADADFEADQSLAEAVQALGRYGLGTKRTLDQFIDFTGVDTRTGIVFKDRYV